MSSHNECDLENELELAYSRLCEFDSNEFPGLAFRIGDLSHTFLHSGSLTLIPAIITTHPSLRQLTQKTAIATRFFLSLQVEEF
ncbi:hypothetical protein L6452_14587 [Arctium lappa]|uniref:Uncharacterized protein n=1 Tax=Arctium lappa TaxID=4217 RepID=A0ACB9CLE9_ARCLA|nr:hypothetical protein L6452_14587 [Arctium lappa]